MVAIRTEQDEVRSDLGRNAGDDVALVELRSRLAIDGQFGAPVARDLDLDDLGRVEHQRPIKQHVRRHRRQQNCSVPGRHDWTARRQRVRRRTGRSRNDQAVGRVVREWLAIDTSEETDGVAGLALLDDRLIQRTACTHTIDLDIEHHPIVDAPLPCFRPGKEFGKRIGEVDGLDFGQVAERTQVDAE